MKEIKLKNGKVVLVDDEDYDWLTKFNWSLSAGYVVSGRTSSTFRQMHLAIWWRHHKCFTPNTVLDHIDRVKLNNQKINLREVTPSVSNYNRKQTIEKWTTKNQ
jgi:hypothetical protein